MAISLLAPLARAKAIAGACLALGAADLAIIDFQIAPALLAPAPASDTHPAEASPEKPPLTVSSAEITHAEVPRASSAPPAAPTTMREEYTVLFTTDNARLDKTALAQLDRIAPGGVMEVSVDGYADPRGTSAYNLALSEKRAAAIAEALAARGVAVQRVRGLGAVRPLATANDPDTLRHERRVEVHIARRLP